METEAEVPKKVVGKKVLVFHKKIFLIPGWRLKKRSKSHLIEERQKRFWSVVLSHNYSTCFFVSTLKISHEPPTHINCMIGKKNKKKTNEDSHLTPFSIWDGSLRDWATREERKFLNFRVLLRKPNVRINGECPSQLSRSQRKMKPYEYGLEGRSPMPLLGHGMWNPSGGLRSA